MDQLQVSDRGLRKRRSTTAIREDGDVRKQVANTREKQETEEQEGKGEELDVGDLIVEIKEIQMARRTTERQKIDNGMRTEKKARMIPRPHCCACGERPGVKSDGTCACGHMRCPECMILESYAS